jgi:hypothetical protein
MVKFTTGRCYFLAFDETHHLIVSLPGTIIIIWYICQTHHLAKAKKVLHFVFKISYPMQKCKPFYF